MSKKANEGVEFRKQHVMIGKHNTSYNTSIGDTPFKHAKENKMDVKKFQKQVKMQIHKSDDINTLTFDIIGIDASIANALRRILIAEVPTVAVDRVFVENNTSVMQDEVLSHRLGLIPIYTDPSRLEYPTPPEDTSVMLDAIPEPNPAQHYVFKLDVTCNEVGGRLENDTVYSEHLQWIPIGDQAKTLKNNPPKLAERIPIVKLGRGQTINLTVFCSKGIGRDHAKWSPVATATYRILPHITFKQSLSEAQANELVKMCPMNVFEIEDENVVVKRPRNCTMCRECIRHPGWEDLVQLARTRDHFIFSIESTGAILPNELFRQAIQILKTKCQTVTSALDALE